MISPADYIYITGLLGVIDTIGLEAVYRLDSMISALGSSAISITKASDVAVLQNTIFTAANTVTNTSFTTGRPLINVVVTLQKLILTQQPTVDAYLTANNLLVTPAFANLSQTSGYPISPLNISL